MPRVKKIIVLCDSHGAGYSGSSFLDYLGPNIEVRQRLCFGGWPANKVHDYIKENIMQLDSDFDEVLISLGNPDVHPRLNDKVKMALGKVHPRLMRESTYALPPRLGLKYLLKVPLFLLKRALMLFTRVTCYNSPASLELHIRGIISYFPEKKIKILSIFKLNELIYGSSHNKNAEEMNHRFKAMGGVSVDFLNFQYASNYAADFFHFKSEFHMRLGRELQGLLCEDQRHEGLGKP